MASEQSSVGGGVWDVIVVGAGIEGSWTAYHSRKNGNKTLLLEQFILPHTRGSSHGQSRIIRKAYVEDHYAAMMNEAYDLWFDLEKEGKVSLYEKTGMLCVGKPGSEAVKNVEKSLIKINSAYKSFTAAELKEKFPMLSFEGSGGLFDEDAGILRADRCLKTVQQLFEQNGGSLRDGEVVEKIIPGDIVTVTTNRGQYRAKSIIITAGPWTAKLTKPLGLNLPLQCVAISVPYWGQKQRVYDKDKGFPTFIDLHSSAATYGLPSEEYAGLFKSIVVSVFDWNQEQRMYDKQKGFPTFLHINGYYTHIYGLPVDEYAGLFKCKAITVLYWNQTQSGHETKKGFPAFIGQDYDDVHTYGLPAGEYPQMFKCKAITVLYWNQTQSGHESKKGFPAFIGQDYDDVFTYGLPAGEYPQMFKPLVVSVCHWQTRFDSSGKPYMGLRDLPPYADYNAAINHCGVYGASCFDYPNLFKLCLHDGTKIDPDRRDIDTDKPWDIEFMQGYVRRHFPYLEDKPSIIERCIYTNTPDNGYIMDSHPKFKNIVIGAGFSGHGFKLAPVVGKVLTELATGRTPRYKMAPFSIARFGNTGMGSKL